MPRCLLAVGLWLVPPGMAVAVRALVPGTAGSTLVIVVRFLLFGAGVVAICRLAGTLRAGGPPIHRYAISLTAVASIGAGLEALFQTAYANALQVAVLTGAAATEEVVFRVELPTAIAGQLAIGSTFARDLGAAVAAQLSFAATHLALHGRISGSQDALELVRLFGCGACSAILYRVGGLEAASLVHAFANYATYASPFGLANYPSTATIALWVSLVPVALAISFRVRSPAFRSLFSVDHTTAARPPYNCSIPDNRAPTGQTQDSDDDRRH